MMPTWRAPLWLLIPALCACVPLVVNYYEPRSKGELQSRWGGCSLAPGVFLRQHLPSNVNMDVHPVAESTGMENELTIAFDVPAGTSVTLTEPAVVLRDSPSGTPVMLKVDGIVGPHSLQSHGSSLDPGEPMVGPGRYGFGWGHLSLKNFRELIVKLPPLIIDGEHVEVESVEFVLKRRPRLVCMT